MALACLGTAAGSAASDTEEFALPAHQPYVSQIDYEVGELYQVVASGTITAGDGIRFDPFYWNDDDQPKVGNLSANLDVSYTGSDQQGPIQFTSKPRVPGFNLSRTYAFVMDAIPRNGTLTWESGRNLSSSVSWRGALSIAVTPLDALGPKVSFNFLQHNLVGHVRTTTHGRGKIRLEHAVGLTNETGKYRGAVSATPESLRSIRIAHLDEYVVAEDDEIVFKPTGAIYGLEATPRAVFESILFSGAVSASNDTDCEPGTFGTVLIKEPKGRGGNGKVTVRLKCPGHRHGAFTERRKKDVVRVTVKGPRPEVLTNNARVRGP